MKSIKELICLFVFSFTLSAKAIDIRIDKDFIKTCPEEFLTHLDRSEGGPGSYCQCPEENIGYIDRAEGGPGYFCSERDLSPPEAADYDATAGSSRLSNSTINAFKGALSAFALAFGPGFVLGCAVGAVADLSIVTGGLGCVTTGVLGGTAVGLGGAGLVFWGSTEQANRNWDRENASFLANVEKISEADFELSCDENSGAKLSFKNGKSGIDIRVSPLGHVSFPSHPLAYRRIPSKLLLGPLGGCKNSAHANEISEEMRRAAENFLKLSRDPRRGEESGVFPLSDGMEIQRQ